MKMMTTQHWGFLAASAGTVALTVTAAVALIPHQPAQVLMAPNSTSLRVAVVDETGAPVPQATIEGASQDGPPIRVGSDGQSQFPLAGPTVLTIKAPEHLPRAIAAEPGMPTRVTLVRQTSSTYSLRFGGDTMFARRFYKPSKRQPLAQLNKGATPEEHAALLKDIKPFLDDSDLTVINLETALTDNFETNVESDTRDPAYHPEKLYILTTATAAAAGLKLAGVDVVSLANNHLLDVVQPGVSETLDALDKAGVRHFGAGMNEDSAWEPAYVQIRGRTVAFVGCSTVTGRSLFKTPIVAGPNNPGPAACSTTRMTKTVKQAKSRAQDVVVFIHGGTEYQREQGEPARKVIAAASEAGAAVVMASHPHVTGGFTKRGNTVIGESLGNFAFDQEVWPTLFTYTARMDLTNGSVVNTMVNPMVLDEHQPTPTTGRIAQASARIAAGTLNGPFRLSENGAHLPAQDRNPETTQLRLTKDEVRSFNPGWFATGKLPDWASVGEDLLGGTGAFDKQETAADAVPGALWSLGRDVTVSETGSCSGGSDVGIRMDRSPLSQQAVVASPIHRLMVKPGDKLSFVVDIKSSSSEAELDLRWYKTMSGDSSDAVTKKIGESKTSTSGCRQVRLDAVVPQGMTAVQPFVSLHPTHETHLSSHLFFDNARLIRWAPAGQEAGRRYDAISTTQDGTINAAYDPVVTTGWSRPNPLSPKTGNP